MRVIQQIIIVGFSFSALLATAPVIAECIMTGGKITITDDSNCFRNDKLHGQWRLQFDGGTVAFGRFENGEKQGVWREEFADGLTGEGEYHDGVKSGRWKWQYGSGTVAQGAYVDGKRNGKWENTFADGQVDLVCWQDGQAAAAAACGLAETDASRVPAVSDDGKLEVISELALPEDVRQFNIAAAEAVAATHFSMEYLTGRLAPASHPAFTKVHARYATHGGMWLRQDAYDSFVAMHAAAAADGVELVIVSAHRDYRKQRRIWQTAWQNRAGTHPDALQRARKILQYKAMPGASRHHWGTEVDLNSLQNGWFEFGRGLALYRWLSEHAAAFGFCQVYGPREHRGDGYLEEKWHWSYLPAARELMRQAGDVFVGMRWEGFDGAETAEEIDVLGNYVLSLDPGCR